MCNLIGITTSVCASAQGGISHFYVAPASSITAVTVGTGANAGVVTGITVTGGPGVFKRFVPTKNQTAFFNQTGERPNEFSNTHVIKQELFAQFAGVDKARIDAMEALKDCCQLVAIVVTNTGTRLIMGLELDSTATGGFVLAREASCRATTSVLTDTSANEARAELRLNASTIKFAPTTNLTDTAIEAL